MTITLNGVEYILKPNIIEDAKIKFLFSDLELSLLEDPLYVANYLDAYCGYDPKSRFHTVVHKAAELLRQLQQNKESVSQSP